MPFAITTTNLEVKAEGSANLAVVAVEWSSTPGSSFSLPSLIPATGTLAHDATTTEARNPAGMRVACRNIAQHIRQFANAVAILALFSAPTLSYREMIRACGRDVPSHEIENAITGALDPLARSAVCRAKG
jgi:hypothetical protein